MELHQCSVGTYYIGHLAIAMAMEYIMNMRFCGHYIQSNMKNMIEKHTVRSNASSAITLAIT